MVALISQHQVFDPDSYSAAVVGISAELADHDSGEHQHQRAQILFASRGCMTVTLAEQWLILPPTRIIWIPSGVRHRVQLRGQVAYRSLYFADSTMMAMPHSAVLAANPLLAALIERIAHWPFDYALQHPQADDLLRVLRNELNVAEQENTNLTLPNDPRIAAWIGRLNDVDQLPGLAQLAKEMGLHPKTLTRVFLRETGLSYQQWCQQWRLMHAIELLAQLPSVSAVAQRLAFSSDSAFIAFFRQYTGTTPKRFMAGGERVFELSPQLIF
ncbi:TPA: helix-turn-helix transcriptional regulator [Serratia fonticola]